VLTPRAATRAVRVTRDGVLVIEGERKQEEEKEENGFKRYERVFGQFVRRFRLVRAPASSHPQHSLGAFSPRCQASLTEPFNCGRVHTSLASLLEASARLKGGLMQPTCSLASMRNSRDCHARLMSVCCVQPDNVEAQKIKAKTENGVLHIEVRATAQSVLGSVHPCDGGKGRWHGKPPRPSPTAQSSGLAVRSALATMG